MSICQNFWPKVLLTFEKNNVDYEVMNKLRAMGCESQSAWNDEYAIKRSTKRIIKVNSKKY